MDINEIKSKYLPVRLLDKDEKGTIEIVEADGRKYVLRTMNGNISSYMALRKIVSPYLPKIEFAEYENGRTVVVEEYIEGEKNISSLTDERAVVSAFCELCDVLTLLHSRGIIHRDIKPSNILIAPDGHIRLIDLDASRYYDDSKENDTRYLGTKGYAPPEQFGYSQTNATADIYSLGVTLKNVLGEKAEKRKFSRIIRKCTEFDPKNRYPSAAAVKKALRSGNITFLLPILAVLAASTVAMLCFLLIYPAAEPEIAKSETLPSEISTASSEKLPETSLTSVITSGSAAASAVTSSETTVPTTEETTTVPETELTSETEETTVTAETSETMTEAETTSASSVTSVSTTKLQTSKTTKRSETTKSTETAASAASVTKDETTATTAQTSVSAPAGTMLMVCTTDKLRTPASSVVKISGRNFDELSEPWTFDPDEAVIGTWDYLTSTGQGTEIFDRMYYKKIVSDPKNATYPQSLHFNEDGTCRFKTVYPSSGTIYSEPIEWTYGMLKTLAIKEYYFYEHYYIYSADDGKEYLFLEIKNGDYMNAEPPSAGIHYMIYERGTTGE